MFSERHLTYWLIAAECTLHDLSWLIINILRKLNNLNVVRDIWPQMNKVRWSWQTTGDLQILSWPLSWAVYHTDSGHVNRHPSWTCIGSGGWTVFVFHEEHAAIWVLDGIIGYCVFRHFSDHFWLCKVFSKETTTSAQSARILFNHPKIYFGL